MYCPSCGEEIPDGSSFCSHCGANVDEFGKPVGEEEAVEESDLAAIGIDGPLDEAVLDHCLSCLRAAEILPEGCAWVATTAIILVPRRTAPDALRVVESALTAVPKSGPVTS